MRVYKVLKKREGKLRSCTVSGRNIAITYIPGKAVHAPNWLAEKGYHLCVFRTHALAKRFSDNEDKIWLVNARGVLRKLPEMLNVNAFYRKGIDPTYGSWPMGTIMAKSVKLIKEVK